MHTQRGDRAKLTPPAPTSRALLPRAVSREEIRQAPPFPPSRQGAAWVSKICSVPPKTRTLVQGQGQQQHPRSHWLKTRGEVPAGALCLVVSIALQTPVLAATRFASPSPPQEQAASPVRGVFHTGAHAWGLAPCESRRARWALPHPHWEAPSPPQPAAERTLLTPGTAAAFPGAPQRARGDETTARDRSSGAGAAPRAFDFATW